MEKRTVRIYKAPDGEGKFINKTSQFLQKAQQGAQVQRPEDKMLKYAQFVYNRLSREDSPEEIYDGLMQQGLAPVIAQGIISQVMDKMIDAGELDPDYNKQDEEQAAEQEAPEEEQVSNSQEDEEEVLSNMNYAEDEEEEGTEEEGNEPWATDMYQDGGELISTEGAEEERQIQFPGVESYLPDYNPIVWDNIDALQPQQSLKHGGMPSKKSFVKNVMSIIKRQAGGEGADASNNIGKGNPFDTATNTIENRKSGFLDTLKNQTTKAKTEDIYKKLVSSNDPELHKVASVLAGQQQAPQDYNFPEQPYAQTGGFTGGEDPLYKFVYGGDDEVNPEYYEEDYLPEAQDGKTVDPWEGYEIRKAKVSYTPRVKTTAGGLRGTLLPWNPIGRVTGQTAEQVGQPYNIKDNTPYTGSVQGQTPIARKVTKTTMFGRRPKEWIDIYQAPGNVYGVKPNAPAVPQEAPSSRTPERILSREELKKMREEELGTKKSKSVAPIKSVETKPTSKIDKNATDAYFKNWEEKNKEGIEKAGSENDKLLEDFRNIPEGYSKPEFLKQYGGALNKYFPGGITDPREISRKKSDATSMITEQEGYLGAPFGRPTFGRSESYAAQNLANTAGSQPMTAMPRINDLNMDAESAEDKAIREEMAGVASQPMTAMPTIQAPQLQVNSPEFYGVKGKAKNQRSFDGEAAVNVFNAGTQGVLGMIERRQQGKQERKMMENEFNADNLYATSTDKDRGDWVDYGSQLGQYRFDQMGQDRSGRFSYGQEGGYMQEGGFTEGEEVEMTEAELADFIANGGEVEYI